jgi:chromosome partitioning protein
MFDQGNESRENRQRPKLPLVIVVGNEKGGSGKSTVSIHLATTYLYEGYKVATIDLDGRQSTLTHYIENRINYSQENSVDLPVPEHLVVTPSTVSDERAQVEDQTRLDEEIKHLRKEFDIIIVDTPGSYNHISSAGHRNADILITPINESFIDVDMLAQVSHDTLEIKGPSTYAETVWDIRKSKAEKGEDSFKWIVMKNRMSHTNAKNKDEVSKILEKLSSRIGFELIDGFGERVIYKELYLKGLTVVDIGVSGVKVEMSVSHLAAKYELKKLLDAVGI